MRTSCHISIPCFRWAYETFQNNNQSIIVITYVTSLVFVFSVIREPAFTHCNVKEKIDKFCRFVKFLFLLYLRSRVFLCVATADITQIIVLYDSLTVQLPPEEAGKNNKEKNKN